MDNIIQNIDAEIKASIKNEKPIFIELFKDENTYKGIFTKKIEGDYILSSKAVSDVAVQVKWEGGLVTVSGLESEEVKLNAFLLKDNAAILRAVKEKLAREDLPVAPSFLIGPPGTGKSTVIVDTVAKCIKNQRILILSPTHMAVENVFERLDLNALGLKDSEIVLNIKTENERLMSYNTEALAESKKIQLEDEREVLESAKTELLKGKRDLETTLSRFESKIEQNSIFLKNISNDIKELDEKEKKEKQNLRDLEKRLNSLQSNSVLNNISKVFTSSSNKIDEIKSSISLSNATIIKLNNAIETKKKELEKTKGNIDNSVYLRNKYEFEKILKTLDEVTKRLKEITLESDNISNANPFKEARLVGATLVSAATNKRLQMGEFDKILIDEASMALFPFILAASQCLNQEDLSKIVFVNNAKLTPAQNKGVELLSNSKLGLIGDPRQLTAIAVTSEMRQTVFDLYDIDRIFDGEKVDNTVLLDINFRNHPDIVNLASKLFYGGLLKAGKKTVASKSIYLLNNKSSMTSVDSSFVNLGNSDIVVEQITKALAKGRRSVGVITPYKEQAKLLNKKLESLRSIYPDADIQAGTIHKFQGKEKDVIIFDLCFSSTSDDCAIPKAYDGAVGSETAKLLNVAMTRAETFFILLGDIDGIKNLKGDNLILKDWINEIEGLNNIK